MAKAAHRSLVYALIALAAWLQPSPAQAQSAAGPADPCPNEVATISLLPPRTRVPADLSRSLDAKKSRTGEKIEAKTDMDLLSQGQVLVPRGTRIVGHVVFVQLPGHASKGSALGISFDRLLARDKCELALQFSIQAIGPPLQSAPLVEGYTLSPVPANPPGANGGDMQGPQRSGRLSQPVYQRPAEFPSALSLSASGIVGIRDLSLSVAPRASVIYSSRKNVHLDQGAQFILQITPNEP